MQIDEKLKLINDLMERKKNENAIKENDVYKLLLAAIDNTALPKLAEDIKLLADKLQSVEKQAPEYYQRALKQLYGLATEIKNTEARLSETNAKTVQNTKQEIDRKNQELTKLIKQVKVKTEELTKELALIQLKHGKDGYTPKKGIDYFDGRPGKDGEDGIGIDGVGIETAEIKGLNLIITLTNGETIDVGKVVGRDGWSASGKSAYQYAKESGYTGTEQEFFDALGNIGEGGGGGTWGSITGTLSAQTDLQDALNAKQGTVKTGSGTLNFGAVPGGNVAIVTMSDTSIKTDSVVNTIITGTTADHNATEHLISNISVYVDNIINATSFQVTAHSDLRLTGTFSFKYTIL